jgi:hypothetical protein
MLYQFYPYEYLTNYTPANNFRYNLPIDNVIPLMFAESLLRGELLTFDGWLGSDRPPLFSGAILFFNISSMPLEKSYLFIGIFLQSLILPIITETIVNLAKRKLSIIEKVFVSFIVISSPIFIHNIAFLWPKIFAAMFMIIAVYLLFFPYVKSISLAVISSICMLLSMLSHGGSGFAIISLAIVYILKMKDIKDFYRGIIIFVVFVAGYAPWFLYQKLVQPPGDRLIKWQLLGQANIVPESVEHVFREQYKDFQYFDILVRVFQSFKNQFLDGFIQMANTPSFDLFTGLLFFKLPFAVGMPFVVAIILLLFLKDRDYGRLMVVALTSIIVWFALPFIPVMAIHEGTYFTPFLLIVACVYGVLNVFSGRLFLITILILSGLANMIVMDAKREVVSLSDREIYQFVDIKNYNGGLDFGKKRIKNMLVFGSHLSSDEDVADFTLEAKSGNSIYYITGPSPGRQVLEVYGDGKLILKLSGEKFSNWEKLSMGSYSQLRVKLKDKGKDWGEWSAIAIRN